MIVFKAAQDKVLDALQSVAGICERRHTLPILANTIAGRGFGTVTNGFPEQGGGGASADVDGDCQGGDGAPVAAASDDDGGDPDPEPARRRPHQHTFAPALLGFASVSHYVGFGRSRIYQLINAGEFPPPVKIGKSSRWVKAEVDAWIGSHSAQRKEARQ